jgi:predicted enzyme related to lactoylglutathione lyase
MMTNKHGDFVWYELMSPDADASSAFYRAVIGWHIDNPKGDGFDYREIRAGEAYIGGLLALTPDMTAGGARPAWVGYIAVDDVDASVTGIEKAGGRLCMPARDLEGVGRFAMMFDPQGAIFYVMTSATDDTSHACSEDKGHCSWNELATSDQPGALDFYTHQFGWGLGGVMDMGPGNTYQAITHGGREMGAIYKRPPEMPVTAWTYYFRVPDIEAATDRVKAKGGQVVNGPTPVSDGDWVVNGVDPQGAFFALVGKHT